MDDRNQAIQPEAQSRRTPAADSERKKRAHLTIPCAVRADQP